ncbi:hypothetical protein ABGB18_38900 [Nonomuraea sp. B12E4]|uniref:hypothetical protein n=1 Tax=Nonomuraea sp. B12E4 TaxID=3153564 RepID=UPI00325DDDD5
MPGKDDDTTREIIQSAVQRLQAISADARAITDLTTRLRLLQKIAGLEKALQAALSLRQVPLEVSQALRAPQYEVQAVHLDVDGRAAHIALHPMGQADAEYELEVWADIRHAAAECTATGQMLRPMNAAIGAIRLDDNLLILNSRQTRDQMRAAKGALQHGLVLAAPLAWAWKKARQTPKQAAAAAAVALAIAAGAWVLTATSSPPEVRPRFEAALDPTATYTGPAAAPSTSRSPAPSPSPRVGTSGQADNPSDDGPSDDGAGRPAARPNADPGLPPPTASRSSRPPSREPDPSGKDEQDERNREEPRPSPPPKQAEALSPSTRTPSPERSSPSTPASLPSTSAPTSQSSAQPTAPPSPPPSQPPEQGECDGLINVEVPPLLEVCL